LGAFDIIETENEILQQQLQQLSYELHELVGKNHVELNSKKQKAFDTRMQMDEIMRKTITYFDNEYHVKAVRSYRMYIFCC
jgi:hypothetical protein